MVIHQLHRCCSENAKLSLWEVQTRAPDDLEHAIHGVLNSKLPKQSFDFIRRNPVFIIGSGFVSQSQETLPRCPQAVSNFSCHFRPLALCCVVRCDDLSSRSLPSSKSFCKAQGCSRKDWNVESNESGDLGARAWKESSRMKIIQQRVLD